MFVQHMLAVLRTGGMAVTVMPHGVLFRGGAEKEIRTGILDADQIDAVIGLGPNLFYGTGIPACILVLRASGAAVKGSTSTVRALTRYEVQRTLGSSVTSWLPAKIQMMRRWVWIDSRRVPRRSSDAMMTI